jgi:hypothetical protein
VQLAHPTSLSARPPRHTLRLYQQRLTTVQKLLDQLRDGKCVRVRRCGGRSLGIAVCPVSPTHRRVDCRRPCSFRCTPAIQATESRARIRVG